VMVKNVIGEVVKSSVTAYLQLIKSRVE